MITTAVQIIYNYSTDYHLYGAVSRIIDYYLQMRYSKVILDMKIVENRVLSRMEETVDFFINFKSKITEKIPF